MLSLDYTLVNWKYLWNQFTLTCWCGIAISHSGLPNWSHNWNSMVINKFISLYIKIQYLDSLSIIILSQMIHSCENLYHVNILKLRKEQAIWNIKIKVGKKHTVMIHEWISSWKLCFEQLSLYICLYTPVLFLKHNIFNHDTLW